MGVKSRASKNRKDGKEFRNIACKSLNVNEEYLSALRSQSYADFFSKAQSLVLFGSNPPKIQKKKCGSEDEDHCMYPSDFRNLHDSSLEVDSSGKVGQQLDVAAKGTYILNRDFDTMSRLVARLHDEVEHDKAMIRFCLERKEDRFSLQVMKELKKSDSGFRKRVEELEEHVYLCLLTINRARALVIEEMTASSIEHLSCYNNT
ncbi:hypothetical protein OIU77_019787 [Salix suchowensis]|uniref:Uncharacterized protein n=1 Tax=Salix suchowensis TaxID=1278906 RepID=A0ABQ9CHG9_9ROSI|nr:hypothetical protein OIU77_019787 [Salix suchowensis]